MIDVETMILFDSSESKLAVLDLYYIRAQHEPLRAMFERTHAGDVSLPAIIIDGVTENILTHLCNRVLQERPTKITTIVTSGVQYVTAYEFKLAMDLLANNLENVVGLWNTARYILNSVQGMVNSANPNVVNQRIDLSLKVFGANIIAYVYHSK